MIRAVLAVATAVALVGVAVPVIEDGRGDAGDRLVRGELAALEHAGESLLEVDEVTPDDDARRIVTLDLPSPTWRSAGVDYLTFHGVEREPEGAAIATYRLDGGRERRVTLGVPLYTGGTPLVLGDGSHRLVLGLAERDDRRVLTVGRLEP